MQIKTAKKSIVKGSIVELKMPKIQGTILQVIQGEKIVLKLMLENEIKHYCYLEDIEKIKAQILNAAPVVSEESVRLN